MTVNSSATTLIRPVVPSRQPSGLWWGLVGVAAFSFTVPFTKAAIAGLSPLFIGSGRAVV
ncbi:MAG TPA: EamA family transporter, partial [Arthrobacter sp.]